MFKVIRVGKGSSERVKYFVVDEDELSCRIITANKIEGE